MQRHTRLQLGALNGTGWELTGKSEGENSRSPQERGWGLVGAAIPLLYIAWSLWLLVMGIA
jgi:hypothetical protein